MFSTLHIFKKYPFVIIIITIFIINLLEVNSDHGAQINDEEHAQDNLVSSVSPE